MRKLAGTICILVLVIPIGLAQTGPRQEQVEIELMTYPEIYSAIHDHGKTTVLVYNGGTEQRGPHAVLGGHTFMARAIAPMVARKLGNALVAPVLPFSVNPAGGVDPKMPGSVALAPRQRPDPRTPRVNNGVTGDPRPSTPEIGKLVVDMKVTNAVAQIQKLIAAKTTGAR